MIFQKLAIIGVGNMGGAIASGLLSKKTIKPNDLVLYDPTISFLEKYEKQGAVIASNPTEAVKLADIILLAVKPQIFSSLLPELKNVLTKKQLVISIAAGVEIKTIKNLVGATQPVVRVMPNLCALVGESMSVWVNSKEVSSSQKKMVQQLLQAIGEENEVNNEDMINAVTAISGSGPAYIFYLTELIENSAKKLGIPLNIASKLARQTVIGSSKLLAASEKSPEELRKNVTSKGGTTEAAFKEFDKNDLKGNFHQGLQAAFNRAKELNS